MFKLLHLKLRCLFATKFVVPCNSRLSEKHFQLGSRVLKLDQRKLAWKDIDRKSFQTSGSISLINLLKTKMACRDIEK